MTRSQKYFNDGLAAAAQEVAKLATYIAFDLKEGAAIAPQVDTGKVIRAIFALMKTDRPRPAEKPNG